MLRKLLPLAGACAAAGAIAVWRMRAPTSMAGKTVFITGGSRGLGLALAREFGAQGCRVAICGRDQDSLEAARQILRDEGTEAFIVACDVTDRQQVESAIASIQAELGLIDVLVNNAGQIRVAPIENAGVEDFEAAMAVMFWGVVYPTLAILPQMRERGSGHIATVASIGGKVSIPHLLPYGCAKFAAVGFCEGLRSEVARHGIQVTTVIPGLMRTGSYRHAEFGGQKKQEAAWFGLAASLPVLAMGAERAARRIVRAIRQGRAELILTPQAKALSVLHGLCPGFVTDALGKVNTLLPTPGPDGRVETGQKIEPNLPSWWHNATSLGRRAAGSLNQ